MPANTTPFVINVGPMPKHHNSCAVVLKFTCGADLERVQAFVDRLVERGIVQPAKAQTYDSNETSAELYFP